VLDAASDEGASVVHLSTSEVLGTNPAVPWSEDSDRVLGSSLADRWSYGTAKATAEHLVLAWSRTRKVPATIIRPFNVYGPRQEPRFVLASMVAAALGGGPILVDGDGSQTRCFTYIDDMVEGMVRVVRSPGSVPIVHLGSEVETSILRVAELVQAATGGVEIAFRSHDDRWGGLVPEIPRRIPDASVARAVFGWQATTPLEAGIDQLVAWAAGADRVPPAASRIASI
ncbi:MAG TPA: NAD-dependent epimerase/dehydratase family protein, partial [Acidimicrobiales bacterium]|nr:NAD-dependent epimerase/dehydratase family protein [Acidimicrobiales bacterium]